MSTVMDVPYFKNGMSFQTFTLSEFYARKGAMDEANLCKFCTQL